MPFPERIGHLYDGVHVTGSAHLGDVYHYEPSPEERAFNAILESLEYPGMHDRRDALTEAHEETFDWTFLDGETQFVEKRIEFGNGQFDRLRTVNMDFKSWLENKDGNMYCVVGKPGSGKSTFM
jgi:ABC-type multidrug transport system fused ATPase/permease subunit